MNKAGWIALAVLIIVVGGISYYVYEGSASGNAYLVGQILGTIAIVGLIAAIVSKRNRRPVRWDVVLTACVIVLIVSNWQKVVAAYDAARLKHELRVAGPDKVLETIQSSQTGAASVTRALIAIAEETNVKIGAVLAELDDSIFENVLAPPKVTDRMLLRAAHDAAAAKKALAEAATAKIDRLFGEEIEKITAAFQPNTDEDIRRGVLKGTDSRHATERQLYVRQVEIAKNLLDALAIITAFLVNDAGSYRVASDGRSVLFENAEIAGRYNALVDKLVSVASEQEKLDADIAAYQAYATERIRALATQ